MRILHVIPSVSERSGGPATAIVPMCRALMRQGTEVQLVSTTDGLAENPDVVVFGHTHKQFCETIGNTLYLNPGYAGKQRFNLPRSVAILTCDAEGITADFFEL